MLYYINGKLEKIPVEKIPYELKFKKWCEKLDELQPNSMEQITETLNLLLDQNEVQTSSWIPGPDWTGTVYEYIFEAAGCNRTTAAMFFGLILYQTVMNHEKNWSCGRYKVSGKDVAGLCYFRISD